MLEAIFLMVYSFLLQEAFPKINDKRTNVRWALTLFPTLSRDIKFATPFSESFLQESFSYSFQLRSVDSFFLKLIN